MKQARSYLHLNLNWSWFIQTRLYRWAAIVKKLQFFWEKCEGWLCSSGKNWHATNMAPAHPREFDSSRFEKKFYAGRTFLVGNHPTNEWILKIEGNDKVWWEFLFQNGKLALLKHSASSLRGTKSLKSPDELNLPAGKVSKLNSFCFY